MSRTVNVNEEFVVVSEGKKDIGKFAVLGNDGKFDPSVVPEIENLQEQITKEVTERTEVDKELQKQITKEIEDRKDADKDLQEQLTKEMDDRINADENLQDQIEVLKGKNSFSKVIVEDSMIEADSQADAIELEAGTNIALTADTDNNKVTIEVTGKVESAENADTIDGYKPNDLVPIGVIAMWSGSIDNIPDKWILCNGTNGTPDLRNKFVLGAGRDYNMGATGGEVMHVLTVEEMPNHNHPIGWYQASGSRDDGSTAGGGGIVTEKIDEGWNDGSTGDIKVGINGGGKAHNNMPPYYVLAYIMRVA